MVRTRFTLNPGLTHLPLAGVRNLVFSSLYAGHNGGDLIIRAEDLDAENNPAGGDLEAVLDSIRWLGFSWKTVLKTGERLNVYRGLAEQFLKEGRAYPCYCTPEEIEQRKKERTAEGLPQHYDGRCRHLTAEQVRAYEKEGRVPSLRFMVYEDDFDFNDQIKGKIKIPAGTVGDFVILRGNGTPIGLFAEAADDTENGVTHVFRTEEPLSGLARQMMVYRALGRNIPSIAQLPVLTDIESRKLSKQSPGIRAHSLEELRTLGYLPEALVNYFALLGWSNPDSREMVNPAELAALFDPERSPSPAAVYDQGKLDWISRHYILNEDKNTLYEKALPFLDIIKGTVNSEFTRGVIELARGYCSCLSEFKDHVLYFASDDFPFNGDAEAALKRNEAASILDAFREWIGKDTRAMEENIFGEMVGALSKKTGIHGRALFTVLRAALTGRTDGPEIYYLIPAIGKDRTLARIDRAIKHAQGK